MSDEQASTEAAGETTVTLTPAQETAIEAVVSQIAPPASNTSAVIDQWFNAHFNDSVVSRNTEIFNYVRSAVDALKQRLAG